MSENKVPPEFEWIKLGAKAIAGTIGEVEIVGEPAPKLGGFWAHCVDSNGYLYDCNCCQYDKQLDTITLTLTRKQAEALLRGVNTGYLESGATMYEIKKQIEEKLSK
jgi:hypothetical protein